MENDYKFANKYKIWNISKEDRWISIYCEGSSYEMDPFIDFVRMIIDDVGGNVDEAGDCQYNIKNDGLGLIYQWDSCFGITVIYPKEISESQALEFLSKYTGGKYEEMV